MTNVPHTTTCVLLAAGAGERFSGPTHKLLATINGTPVIALSLAAMVEAGAGDCVVVTGAEQSPALLGIIDGVDRVVNNDWRTGQRSSVVTAIAEARRRGSSQVVIGLADQPFVGADSWQAVADADAPIAVATFAGRRGNPVKLRSEVWELFENTPGDPDAGARTLMNLRPELVREVSCQGSSDDIDTREDLTKWT
jgi:CTP:molybdopterin cytidylyltransferase MocA